MSDEINPTLNSIDGGTLVPIPGQTLQRMGDQYCTAISVQKPRNLTRCIRALEEEAAIAGEDFYYSWTVKGKDEQGNKGKKNKLVEGVTIGCAMAMARYYGNCVVKAVLVEEKATHWIFNAIFIDLETGYTNNRLYRQNRTGGMGGKYSKDRAEDMVFQTGQSKAVRNIIRVTLPQVMADKAMESAKANVMKRLEARIKNDSLPKVQEAAVAKLIQHGIVYEAILERFQIADKKALTKENLVAIMGDLRAIESGQEYPEVLYPPVDDPEPAKSAQSGKVLEELKENTLKELEQASPGTSAESIPAEVRDAITKPVEDVDDAMTKEEVKEAIADAWPEWCRAAETSIMGWKDMSKTKMVAELIEKYNAGGIDATHAKSLLKKVASQWVALSKGKVSAATMAESNMKMMTERMNDKAFAAELNGILLDNLKRFK